MFVAVALLAVQIPGARSLKDRRRVVNSIRDRLRSRMSISVAEVGEVVSYEDATIGISLVARDGKSARALMDKAIRMAETQADGVVELIDGSVFPWDARAVEGRPLDEDIDDLPASWTGADEDGADEDELDEDERERERDD